MSVAWPPNHGFPWHSRFSSHITLFNGLLIFVLPVAFGGSIARRGMDSRTYPVAPPGVNILSLCRFHKRIAKRRSDSLVLRREEP